MLIAYKSYTKVDARNIPLSKDDLVFCLKDFNYNHVKFGTLEVTYDRGFKSNATYSLTSGYADYIFKVENLLPYNEYCKKMLISDNTSNKSNSIPDIQKYLKIDIPDVLGNMEDKYRDSHNGTLRGYPIVDYLGQDLKPGDFVIYRYEKEKSRYGYKYGVVVSDTKVFTEDKILERVFYVLKLNNLTNDEKVLYDDLVIEYQKTIQNSKKIKSKKFSIGDVYISGKTSYVYLGKIDLITTVVHQSNAISNVHFDKDKEYWVKLPNFIPMDFMNFKNKFENRMETSYQIDYKKEVVSKDFYYKYVSLESFDCIISNDEIPKNLIYYSTINLPKRLHYTGSSYKEYLADFSYIFNLS